MRLFALGTQPSFEKLSEYDGCNTDLEKPLLENSRQISSKGVSYAILSNAIWSLSPLTLAVIYSCTNVSVSEIVIWKSLFMDVSNFILAWHCGHNVINLPRDCITVTVFRAIFGSLALYLNFTSMMYISISKASILFFTAPLYLPFLARYFLNEPISKIDFAAITLGFCGVVLINRPNPGDSDDKILKELTGVALSLLSGICFGLSQICIRQMSNKCHYSIPPFYFSIGCTVLGFLMYIWEQNSGREKTVYDNLAIFLLLVISCITFVGQITLVLAYKYEKVARVTVFCYMQTLLVMIYDIIFFGHSLKLLEIIGAILIMGCNFTVAILKFAGKIS